MSYAKTGQALQGEAAKIFQEAINDGALFREMTQGIIAKEAKKMSAGKWSKERAVEAFKMVANEAAKHVIPEYASNPRGRSCPAPMREAIAEALCEYYMPEMEAKSKKQFESAVVFRALADRKEIIVLNEGGLLTLIRFDRGVKIQETTRFDRASLLREIYESGKVGRTPYKVVVNRL